MSKKTLLLSALVLFSGCAERGYVLTTNTKIQTITAESVTSLDKTSKQDETEIFEKMTTAVKKAQKEEDNTPPALTHKKQKQTIKKQKKKKLKKKITEKKRVIPTFISEAETETKEEIETPKVSEISKTVIYSDDENKLREEARKSRERREARLREIKKLRKGTLAKQTYTKDKPSAQIEKSDTQVPKISNIDTEKNAKMERVRAKEKEAALLAQKAREKEKLTKEKEAALLAQRKQAQEAREKKKQEQKVKNSTPLPQNNKTAFTKPLVFKQIDKIYHKFGTSEVHGHVIYLTPTGQETRLSQTKAYLLPVSAKLNHWFNKYYLKNKNDGKSTIVSYLNQTSLNLERNFEFFGVPKGSYYVIIESTDPQSHKRVYIAKKIHVGKYKKIMGVFSKKL